MPICLHPFEKTTFLLFFLRGTESTVTHPAGRRGAAPLVAYKTVENTVIRNHVLLVVHIMAHALGILLTCGKITAEQMIDPQKDQHHRDHDDNNKHSFYNRYYHTHTTQSFSELFITAFLFPSAPCGNRFFANKTGHGLLS